MYRYLCSALPLWNNKLRNYASSVVPRLSVLHTHCWNLNTAERRLSPWDNCKAGVKGSRCRGQQFRGKNQLEKLLGSGRQILKYFFRTPPKEDWGHLGVTVQVIFSGYRATISCFKYRFPEHCNLTSPCRKCFCFYPQLSTIWTIWRSHHPILVLIYNSLSTSRGTCIPAHLCNYIWSGGGTVV